MSTSLSSKRILITGATGFIGHYLVEEARTAGLEVWIAVRPESDPRKVEALGVKTIALDYNNPVQMRDAMVSHLPADGSTPWHYVIHNAGLTKTANPQDFYLSNAEYTRRLCSALSSLNRPLERFVLMSSMSVYGEPDKARGLIHRDQTPQPPSHYGRSKLLAEVYVQASGLPYTILQPTGVYGPGDYDYLMALESLQKGMNFMAGWRKQLLTFVYGRDVARAAIFVLSESSAEGTRYIVADGASYSDTEFAQIAREELGVQRYFNLRIPLPLLRLLCAGGSLWAKISGKITPLNSDKYHILSQRSWLCDSSPLEALGWKPNYQLRDGLAETIAWARSHKLLR